MNNPDDNGYYARVQWHPSDIIGEIEQRYDVSLTEKEAKDFLARNGKYIQDALITAGWDVIADLWYTDREETTRRRAQND